MTTQKRVTVALDTCVLCSVAEGNPESARWEELIPLKDRFCFRVSRNVLDELSVLLSSGGFGWAKWTAGRERFFSVVERTDLLVHESLDFGFAHEASAEQKAGMHAYENNVWQGLGRATSAEDMETIRFSESDGSAYRIKQVSPKKSVQETAEGFARVLETAFVYAKGQTKKTPKLDQLVDAAMRTFEGSNPALAAEFMRPALMFLAMRWNGYNPKKRGWNDINDLRFLTSIYAPALGITLDGKLIDNARQAKWAWSSYLFKLDGFLELVADPSNYLSGPLRELAGTAT